MADRIATIHGIGLSPGVSKNNRRYTTETIQRAYRRLNARLADPNGRPVVMRSYHPANGSDLAVTNIAGRISGVSLENGDLHFDAEIPDTTAGRDVASLVTAERPYLSNVSLRGWWVGEAITDSDGCESGDDLEIDGFDFVTNPGVDRARILAASVAESDGRAVITESARETTVTLETTEAKGDPTPDGSDYADPGYQKDGKKRYPLNSTKRIRSAWAYINVADNAKPYTAAQLKRIKGKIKSAAKKAGIDVATETAALGADLTEILEAYASSCLDNGQGDIRVSGYTNEPADLAALGQRVALAALAGLAALDPDNDGDIDLAPGDAPDGDDEPTCSNCGLVCDPSDNFCPACGAQLPATETDDNAMEGVQPTGSPTGESSKETETPVNEDTTTKPEEFAGVTNAASPHGGTPAAEKAPAPEAAVTETAKPAAEATAETFTKAQVDGAVAAALKGANEAKPAEGADAATSSTETTTEPVTETAKVFTAEEAREMVKQAVKEAADQMRAEITEEAVALVRSGGRKGVVRPVDESGAPKPLHEMSEEERNAYANDAWAAVLTR